MRLGPRSASRGPTRGVAADLGGALARCIPRTYRATRSSNAPVRAAAAPIGASHARIAATRTSNSPVRGRSVADMCVPRTFQGLSGLGLPPVRRYVRHTHIQEVERPRTLARSPIRASHARAAMAGPGPSSGPGLGRPGPWLGRPAARTWRDPARAGSRALRCGGGLSRRRPATASRSRRGCR